MSWLVLTHRQAVGERGPPAASVWEERFLQIIRFFFFKWRDCRREQADWLVLFTAFQRWFYELLSLRLCLILLSGRDPGSSLPGLWLVWNQMIEHFFLVKDFFLFLSCTCFKCNCAGTHLVQFLIGSQGIKCEKKKHLWWGVMSIDSELDLTVFTPRGDSFKEIQSLASLKRRSEKNTTITCVHFLFHSFTPWSALSSTHWAIKHSQQWMDNN